MVPLYFYLFCIRTSSMCTMRFQTGPFGYTYKETKVSLELGNLSTELDITIQDRVNTLLSTLAKPKPAASQFGQSLLTPVSWLYLMPNCPVMIFHEIHFMSLTHKNWLRCSPGCWFVGRMSGPRLLVVWTCVIVGCLLIAYFSTCLTLDVIW